MKIIKEGDLGRLARTRRFACKGCGCVFEAGPSEYRRVISFTENVYMAICPTCKSAVEMTEEKQG